jgi:hypothetical protein
MGVLLKRRRRNMAIWKPSKDQMVLIRINESLLNEMGKHWYGWMSRQRQRDCDSTCRRDENIGSTKELYQVVASTESIAQYLLVKMEKGIRFGGIKISRKR